MSKLNRHTRFIEDGPSTLLSQGLMIPTAPTGPQPRGPDDRPAPAARSPALPHTTSASKAEPSKPSQKRLPVKRSHVEILVPVLSGSPWKHYVKKYRVQYWCSFGIVTRQDPSRQLFMIRTISGSKTEEHIQNIRQLCHPNLVESIEFYICSDMSHYVISEFLPTSLLHICRSPLYPTEEQLGSILHQVLLGVEYLSSCSLVHEEISCAAVLINFTGEVKISDIERCKQDGDHEKLFDAFSRMIMILMDKDKSMSATVGLTRLDRWSAEAIDMFTTSVSNPTVEGLLRHPFLAKRHKEELKWLVPFVLITAHHSRE